MGTAKNPAGAIGKDEVPGPNPGSSSRNVPEIAFASGFRNFFVTTLQRVKVN